MRIASFKTNPRPFSLFQAHSAFLMGLLSISSIAGACENSDPNESISGPISRAGGFKFETEEYPQTAQVLVTPIGYGLSSPPGSNQLDLEIYLTEEMNRFKLELGHRHFHKHLIASLSTRHTRGACPKSKDHRRNNFVTQARIDFLESREGIELNYVARLSSGKKFSLLCRFSESMDAIEDLLARIDLVRDDARVLMKNEFLRPIYALNIDILRATLAAEGPYFKVLPLALFRLGEILAQQTIEEATELLFACDLVPILGQKVKLSPRVWNPIVQAFQEDIQDAKEF